MLATGVLIASLLAPVAGLKPPEPPPRFRGPEAIQNPLDLRLAGRDPRTVLPGNPADWCPSGEDFLRWQAGREKLAAAHVAASRPATVKSHGGLPNVHLEPNGVVVIEDDGTMLRYDRRPDLEGQALTFTPDAGGGYSVTRGPAAYDTNVGTLLIDNVRGWGVRQHSLTGFAFPFAGDLKTDLWITTTMSIAFSDPAAPGPAQLHFGDALADRTQRIAPMQTGTSIYGWTAYVREDLDRVVITWQVVDGGWLDLAVQATLLNDGSITLTYQSLRGVQHGTVAVVTDDPAWWADRQPAGSASDPAGDITDPPAPDGPAVDIVEVRAYQIAGSEILQIEVQLVTPLPPATDAELQFAIQLRDDPGDPDFNTLWGAWNDGAWAWTNTPIEIIGDTLRYQLQRSDLPLTDDDLQVTVWAGQNWGWQEVVGADFAYPVAPPDRLHRDFSTAPFPPIRGPLLESFTMPELQIGPVYDAFMEHFHDPRLDGLAVFQNFETDIVFYAGAWSTVGNAGADGIGTGNTTDPEAPALLHMNKLLYGWNSWDEGKTLVMSHEFGHHWLYFPSIDESGTVGKPLGDGHPAGWVHTPAAAPVFRADDSSCMGGSTWTDNADGTFRSAPVMVNHGYSWPELYFMGLADPSEVPDFFYIQNSNPPLPGAYWPPDDSLVTGTRADVTVQQFIDAMGPRNPAASPRNEFIVPFVLLVRPGEIAQADIDETARHCAVWTPGFHAATDDRATVVCNRVGNRPPTVTITDPPANVTIFAGDSVSFSGIGEDPDYDTVDLTWAFDGAAPAEIGGGPHVVTFARAGAYFVTLSGRDSTGLDALAQDLRIVTVQCRRPPAVSGLRVTHDRFATLAFTWDALPDPVDEHVVFSSLDLRVPEPFLNELRVGASGLSVAMPPERLVFFKVAARNLPDCLGPLEP